MIPLCLKYTAKHDVATPLQSYLETRYSKEEAAKHADCLTRFQALRNDVASITAANDGARTSLMKYYAQAGHAESKFPVSETNVKIAFTWTDIFVQNRQISQYSWTYERACVLFNLAAIESMYACGINRATPEAMEKAALHFCTAAGILEFIKRELASKLLGTVPWDLTPAGLTSLSSLQLAQGQACFYEIADNKGMKNETLARVAGQAADLYRAAARAFSDQQWAAIDKSFPWSGYMHFHFTTFDAVSFWQMSQKALTEASAKGSGYGVELGWLTVAAAAANKAVADVKGSKNPGARTIDTTGTDLLLAKVQARKTEAESDNRKIYVEPVTPASSLGVVPRAELAKLKPVPDMSEFEKPDFFASIVPVEVAAAMNVLEERLTQVVADTKEECTRATDGAKSLLSSLGLPGCLDAADPAQATRGVPPSLWERIKKTQIEGGLPEILRLQSGNAAAAGKAHVTLSEVLRVLDEEAAADAACRRSYGDRWTATPSEIISGEVRGEVAKYLKVAEAAASTDAQVTAKIEANRARLAAIDITRSKADIDATVPAGYIPAAGSGGAGGEAEAMRLALKESVAQMTSLMDARIRLSNEIKEKFDRPAAVTAFLASDTSTTAVNAIVDRLLATSSPQKALVTTNLAAQGPLLETIKAQHARYMLVRAQDERTRAREAALQELSESVDKYEEIRSNLNEGGMFYADLNREADRLLIVAKDTAAARGLQQRELMMGLRSQDDAALARSMAGGGTGSGATPAGMGMGAAPVQAYPRMGSSGMGAAAGGAGGMGAAPVGTGRAMPVMLGPSGSTSPMSPSVPTSYNPFDHFAPAPAVTGLHHGGMAIPTAIPLSGPTATGMGGFGAAPMGGHPAAMGMHGGYSPMAAAPTHAAPVSVQLQQLLNMGFDRPTAERALAMSSNDVSAALDALLSGAVPTGSKYIEKQSVASGKPVAATLTGFQDIPASDDASFQAALAQQPVWVAIEADQMCFQFYSSGVLNCATCGTQLDHGVLAVGYGTMSGQDYYKVKNSWGSDWGASGYVYMLRGSAAGSSGECGILLSASVPQA